MAGYTEVARALVEHRCDSELCRAHATGGAGVDFEMPSGPASTQVDTSRGGFGTIKSFFESGNGATALHAACENGHLGVVKVLATNGVDVNTRGMQGVTPLYSSISYNHPEITEYLVRRAKADVNRRMKRDGDTAMMIAIKFARGTSAHIPILLRAKGLDLEVRNKAGQTALMVAAGMGRHDVVSQLLFAGADASATVQKKGKGKGKGGDESSGSVLHVAIEQGSTVVVEQLLAAGAVSWPPRYRCHLGCILLKMAAMTLSTGRALGRGGRRDAAAHGGRVGLERQGLHRAAARTRP